MKRLTQMSDRSERVRGNAVHFALSAATSPRDSADRIYAATIIVVGHAVSSR